MADKLTFAGAFFSTPAETTMVANTPIKAAGTTTLSLLSQGFTQTANNRLQLDAGQATRTYRCTANIAVSKAGGGATNGSFYIAKNGTIDTDTAMIRTLANTADVGSIIVIGMEELAAGDYIELWIETDTGDNLTIEAGGIGCGVIG